MQIVASMYSTIHDAVEYLSMCNDFGHANETHMAAQTKIVHDSTKPVVLVELPMSPTNRQGASYRYMAQFMGWPMPLVLFHRE